MKGKKKAGARGKGNNQAKVKKPFVADPEVLKKLEQLRATETGRDGTNGTFDSWNQMWEKVVANKDAKEGWYGKSEKYWDGIEPTVNGMLGGLEEVSEMDITESTEFLRPYINGRAKRKVKSDVGAGIGRISKLLLSRFFDAVDLVEVTQKFLDEAKKDLANFEQVKNFYCSSMQDFIFPRKYDVIWIQWVIIYLSDEDFVTFFSNCREALTDSGIIVVKDNVTNSGFVLDAADASVTRYRGLNVAFTIRSEHHLRLLFEASGLKVVQDKVQPHFPKELFPVKMFALCPILE